ncbi:hypothetical protein [Limosilactobacillus reuteri]|uniref:hypothetical protein n=1 Tax=Limosilactobacillus reuteri TaxID=1598 RepID=UPI00195E58E7|nr:hypothetical protein [Limosilactobacillus reuteri]MBM6812229.1 hypothetical protein [Limosilactobacillus reuteri]
MKELCFIMQRGSWYEVGFWGGLGAGYLATRKLQGRKMLEKYITYNAIHHTVGESFKTTKSNYLEKLVKKITVNGEN